MGFWKFITHLLGRIVRFFARVDEKKLYGLDHAILNLEVPPPSMWMNMGYWKVGPQESIRLMGCYLYGWVGRATAELLHDTAHRFLPRGLRSITGPGLDCGKYSRQRSVGDREVCGCYSRVDSGR